MEEGKEVETPPKESLVYGVKWDIDGSTYFTERKGKGGFVKESYYLPRSEEEKKQIIERNKKRREQEKSQKEVSTTGQDKEVKSIDLIELADEIGKTQTETPSIEDKKENDQPISQKPDNKEAENNF